MTKLEKLKAAIAHADERLKDYVSRYDSALAEYYLLNGNPKTDWIIYDSRTLKEFREHRRRLCFSAKFLEGRGYRIYRKKNGWFTECTKQALKKLAALEKKIDSWWWKKADAEDKLAELTAR